MSNTLETSSLFSLKDRTALVTGALSGLGKSVAEGLVQNGVTVFVTGRNAEAAEALAAALNAQDESRQGQGRAIGLKLDVTSPSNVLGLPRQLEEHLGSRPLDILVLNAGIVRDDAPFDPVAPLLDLQRAMLSSKPQDWADQFATNATSVYHLTASLLHLLAASPHHGRVIVTSSIGARHVYPQVPRPGYQASKAAVEHVTRILASKLRSTGIRVNAIAPGYFDTPMNDASVPGTGAHSAQSTVPAGRCGNAADIFGATAFLASRAGDYVNGQVLDLDGGRLWA